MAALKVSGGNNSLLSYIESDLIKAEEEARAILLRFNKSIAGSVENISNIFFANSWFLAHYSLKRVGKYSNR